ncbi:hypothetical protein OG719_38085 [Microbispora hainanensis]
MSASTIQFQSDVRRDSPETAFQLRSKMRLPANGLRSVGQDRYSAPVIRSRRVVWPALVSVLVLGGLAGEPDLTVHSVLCISTSMGAVASMSCGDPEFEAEMKANALTPEEAKSIGCPPVQWDDEAKLTPDIPQDPGFPSDEPTYTPRTPDPAIAARVNQAWDRIERWLGAHASATLRKLKFGADPQNLAGWEANDGRRLPDADGGADPGEADDRGAAGSLGFGPAPFYELMPAKQIHSEWKMLCYIGPDGYWRDGHLIPLRLRHRRRQPLHRHAYGEDGRVLQRGRPHPGGRRRVAVLSGAAEGDHEVAGDRQADPRLAAEGRQGCAGVGEHPVTCPVTVNVPGAAYRSGSVASQVTATRLSFEPSLQVAATVPGCLGSTNQSGAERAKRFS